MQNDVKISTNINSCYLKTTEEYNYDSYVKLQRLKLFPGKAAAYCCCLWFKNAPYI